MPSPTSLAAFKINGTTIADTATATVAISRQQIDVTSIGAAYRDHVQGFLEGTVTVELFVDASHASVLSGIGAGTKLTNAEVAWSATNYIKGDAWVQDFSVTVAPNGVAQATATLLFSGSSLTYA